MEANDKNSEQMYDDFYKKLRRRIKSQLNSWNKKRESKRRTPYELLVEMLFFLPDFFHLAVKLFFDKNVPAKNKGILLAAIVYVVSPIDLIPDVIPVAGWIDDLIVIAMALNKFLDTEDKRVKDAVERYWAGEEDIFEAIKHIIKLADSVAKSLPKNVIQIIKGMFKGK